MSVDVVLPPNERERLTALRRYDVLDTPPDGTFDRIAATAARIFSVPIAIVSIVDTDRVWFKSHHGLDATEVGREPGLCASAILSDAPWIVTDASTDVRAMANPLVAGEFGLRFYAGAPLTTADGFNLGTLCVIDREPRQVTEEETQTLVDLASVVVDQLELRLAARQAVAAEESRRAELERLATTLQASLLPPSLPGIPHSALSAYYRPANRLQVGGDFYDVFPLDERSWGLVIGDVCGKGTEAAALTSRARYCVRTAAIRESAPSAVLRVVNQALLAAAAPDEPFVTAIFARVEPGPERTVIRFCVGGHPLPLVLRADAEVSAVGAPGSLLGVLEDVELTDSEVELGPGDTVVLVTDGVLDSGRAPGGLGRAGVERVLRGCRGLSVDQIVVRVHQVVDSAQCDDIAILALSRLDPRP